jgi:hypothetical protein
MDPRNPISDLNSINIDCFASTPGKGDRDRERETQSLTPDDTTAGSSASSRNEKENQTVDPKLVDFPLSISSPANSEGEGGTEFHKWDWDNELGSM